MAIVGVGLLGGSLALAARERGLCREVVGVGRNPTTLAEAQRLEVIDSSSTDLTAGIAEADLVVLCTPVRHIVATLPQIMSAAKPGAVVTDVGSTKASIVRAGEAAMWPGGAVFIGSHPMAGSEKSGVHHARANLYENATCFVTKTATSDLAAFGKICALWQAVGSRVVVARPERHDRLVARVSHLPHLLAVALVRTVDAAAEDKNLIKGIIGNGFRDTTRIACGSPDMWEDICADNTGEIARARGEFEAALVQLMDAVAGGGTPAEGGASGGGDAGKTDGGGAALRDMLEEACELRGFLDHR